MGGSGFAPLPLFAMNFIAHFAAATRLLSPALPTPLYVMANALPDLLPLAAPRARLRPALLDATPHLNPEDTAMTAGARMHLLTDEVFHKTRAFVNAQREAGPLIDRAGFTNMRARRFFLAHVLTELALDAHLVRQEPALVDTFYAYCADADGMQITRWAEAATLRPLPALPQTLARFAEFQYLRFYADDAGVAEGFNRLCARARQDTFKGDNEQRLVTLTTQIAALMDAGLAQALLDETYLGLR